MNVHDLGESLAGDIVQDVDGSVLFSAGLAFQRLAGKHVTQYPLIQDPYGFGASYTGGLAVNDKGDIYDSITWVDFYYSPEHSIFQGANFFPKGTTAGTFVTGSLNDDTSTAGGATDALGQYWTIYNYTFVGFVGAYIIANGIGSAIVEIPPNEYQTLHFVDSIARGPGNDMWVTGHNGYETSSSSQPENLYLVSSGGILKTFAFPNGVTPGGMATDAHGNLWYTDAGNNAIGELRLPAGTFREFGLPSSHAGPGAITLGADGDLWFAESAVNKIGRITIHGKVKEYAIPIQGHPAGITGPNIGSPDCKRQLVWFVEKSPGSGSDAVVSISTRH